MKVICPFSLLLRLAFWLTASALVAGVALGHQPAPVPAPQQAGSVVAAYGKEVR